MASATQNHPPRMLMTPAAAPRALSNVKLDSGTLVIKLVAGVLFFVWAAWILWTAISLGPITIVGLVGICSYIGLLLYFVWQGGLEEEAEHEQAKRH